MSMQSTSLAEEQLDISFSAVVHLIYKHKEGNHARRHPPLKYCLQVTF
jgi:hypothetical protein